MSDSNQDVELEVDTVVVVDHANIMSSEMKVIPFIKQLSHSDETRGGKFGRKTKMK